MKSKLKIEQVFEVIDKLKELYPDDVRWDSEDYGSEEDILKAEKELGVKFPEDFKKFVLKFRYWLKIWAGEIVGYGALDCTLESRELGEGDPDYFPECLIYVCDYAQVYVCIDTSQDNQIVYWDEVMAGEDEDGNYIPNNKVIWYESFTEFLFYYVVEEVEYNVCFNGSEETTALDKEIEYLKTLSSHYNKDKPYLTLV